MFSFSVFGLLGKKLTKTLSFKKRAGVDIVCDVLTEDEKKTLCDEMLQRIIGDEFLSFEPFDQPLEVPHLVDVNNQLTCKAIPIAKLRMEKRMFWCRSRQYYLRRYPQSTGPRFDLPAILSTQGIFCAGTRKVEGRVFAFRPPEVNSKNVTPVGELNQVDLILRKVAELSSKGGSSGSSSRAPTSRGPR